jgi:peroxiredoxin Q/BCP
VIGISTDRIEDQQKFTDMRDLNFPLYADADKKVAKEYGVLTPRGFASRSTFVIDKKGIVRKTYPMAQAKTHPDEVLEYIKENLKEKK